MRLKQYDIKVYFSNALLKSFEIIKNSMNRLLNLREEVGEGGWEEINQ